MFLQLILISLDSASWELHQYSCRMGGPMENPKVETRSRDSNSEPHDCKADAVPHDHGHHTPRNLFAIYACVIISYDSLFQIKDQKRGRYRLSNQDERDKAYHAVERERCGTDIQDCGAAKMFDIPRSMLRTDFIRERA